MTIEVHKVSLQYASDDQKLLSLTAKLYLNKPLKYYHFIAQAELSIPDLDDKQEMAITNVRLKETGLKTLIGFVI